MRITIFRGGVLHRFIVFISCFAGLLDAIIYIGSFTIFASSFELGFIGWASKKRIEGAIRKRDRRNRYGI